MTATWLMLDHWGFAAARYLLAVLWQSSLLFGTVAALGILLRRHTPRARRALWLMALFAAPILPFLSTLAKPSGLPQQELVVFPSYAPPNVPVIQVPSELMPIIRIPETVVQYSPTTPPAPRDYPWAWALIAYIIGAGVFLTWTLAGHIRIRQWIRAGVIPSDSRIDKIFRDAATRLNVRRRVRVVMTDRVPAPITAGIFRATVLLPKNTSDTLSEEDLLAVALHEAVHIRQHDPLILTLAGLVRGVLFFHPLVWLACRHLAVLAEHAADTAVLETTGQPLPYAKLLTTLAERLPRRTPSVEGAAGLIFCKSAFSQRVEAILGDRKRVRRLTRRALACTLVAALLSLGIALALPLGQREGLHDAAKTHQDELASAPGDGGQSTPTVEKAAAPQSLADIRSPEPDRLWLVLLPQSPIADMSQYDHVCSALIPKALVGTPVQPMELEFRHSDMQRVIERFPYSHFGPGNYPAGHSRSSEEVQEVRSKLKGLPDGDYVVAINVNGSRCSNVAQFTIDHSADVKRLPVLELVALEPAPFYTLPFLGVRVTGSDSLQASFRMSDVQFAPVTVDEITRTIQIMKWVGGDPDLAPGARWLRIIDLSGNRWPVIAPGIPHVVRLGLPGYSAGPIDFTPANTLGQKWDAAQGSVKPKLSEKAIKQAEDTARKESQRGLIERRPEGLEHIDSEDAVRQVIDGSLAELDGTDPTLRERAVTRLKYLGDLAFEDLIKGLKSDNPKTRSWSAGILKERGSRAVPFLAHALREDPERDVRSSAAFALGQTYDPQGAPALLAALDDPQFTVRESAIRAFMYLRSEQAFKPLQTLLEDAQGDGQLRDTAAEALLCINREAGTKAVKDAMEKESDECKRHNLDAAMSWRPYNSAYWPPELLGLHQLTRDAYTIAGERFGESEIRQLLEHIGSDNWAVSLGCLLALGNLRVESAVPPMMLLNPRKIGVCSALAMIASPQAVKYLLDVAQSSDEKIREAAVHGLGTEGGRWAVPVLIELLDDLGLRSKGLADQGLRGDMKWPDEHAAHAALRSCLNNAGLKGTTLNLAEPGGRVFNVDEEIKQAKVWWAAHGEDFLQGKSVPNPNLTWVHWSS